MFQLFEKRPLASFASSFYIFACVLFASGRSTRTIILILSAVVFVAVIMAGKSLSRLGIIRAATALSAGLLFASAFSGIIVDVKLAKTERISITNKDVTGVVESVVSSAVYGGYYIVNPYCDIGSAGDVRLLLSTENGELTTGDIIQFSADIQKLDRADDYRYSLYSDGVMLGAIATSEVTLVGKSDDIIIQLSLLKGRLSSKLRSEMSEESGGFAAALILGDKSHISETTTRDFRSLGISHILALSGTHLTVLFLLIGKILPKGAKFRLLRFSVLSGGVLFYMALTGMSSSVVRSGIMFIVAAAAELSRKNTDSFTSLSAAVFLICIISPYSPFDMGLQLSFLAVTGLLVSSALGRGNRNQSLIRRIFYKVVPAVVVPSMVLPLSWLRFGSVSLASPITNLILIPFITPLIPLLLILILVSFIPPLFSILAKAADVIIKIMLSLTEVFASADDFILPLEGILVSVCIALFLLAVLASMIFTGKYRRLSACASVILVSLAILGAQARVTYQHSSTTAYYTSSGTNEGICILSEGHTILIDIGKTSTAVISAAETGVCYGSNIDSFVLTHLHKNHISVITNICGRFRVGSIWLPAPSDSDDAALFSEIANAAEECGASVRAYLPEENLIFGGCVMTAPTAVVSGKSTHPKVRFSVTCGDNILRYVSPGDEVGSSENTVTITGHHGLSSGGIIPFGEGGIVLSPKIALQLDAVPSNAVIADSAVITLGNTPSVSALRDTFQ